MVKICHLLAHDGVKLMTEITLLASKVICKGTKPVCGSLMRTRKFPARLPRIPCYNFF